MHSQARLNQGKPSRSLGKHRSSRTPLLLSGRRSGAGGTGGTGGPEGPAACSGGCANDRGAIVVAVSGITLVPGPIIVAAKGLAVVHGGGVH